MTLIRTIQIRLSREQYNRIKSDSVTFGFNSLSAYLRYLALGKNYILEQKIHEIHKIITGQSDNKTIKIKKFHPFVET